MRLLLALKAFFKTLLNPSVAKRVSEALESAHDGSTSLPTSQPSTGLSTTESRTAAPNSTPSTNKSTPSSQRGSADRDASGRSDALTLLSTLQREARLLDLVHESLDMYTDAQIGAAARDVLRDTRKSLDKMLDIKPLLSNKEGDSIDLPETLSPVRWKLLGSKKDRGVIVHSGWTATKCDIPKWNGAKDDASVLAPAEIES